MGQTKREIVYLTDITLHIRGFKQTTNFSRVAERGRMYSPLPKNYAENEPGVPPCLDSDGTFRFSLELPSDLRERLKNGEIKIMIPKEGLSLVVGRDVYEYLDKNRRRDRNVLIHNSHKNDLRYKKKSVQ